MKLRLFLVLILGATLHAQDVADKSSPPTAVAAAGTNNGASTEANPLTEPLNSAQALMNKRQFNEAAAAFRAILERAPASGAAHAGLVRSLLRIPAIEEAHG